jgi:hypothetical protein
MQGLASDWSMGVRGVLDRVHLPPLPGLPGSRENVDAITAASRPVRSAAQSKQDYTKERFEATGDLRWTPHGGTTRGGGSYYVSRESDYLGQQVSVDMARDFDQANTNLAMRAAFGFDRITPDEHTGGDPAARTRHSIDLVGVCTQTLSPQTLGSLGVELTVLDGFQSNPYRSVYDGGLRQPERHPEERRRGAVFAQVDRYLMTRSSVSLAGRWYRDDWDVQAVSLDARFNQYVGERLIVRYRYRWYTQTAAYFWRELYEGGDGVDGYRTADYKLQEFSSNLFGIKVSVPFEGTTPWLDGLVLDCKYERYFDSKSFAANVLEAGFSWPF